MQVKRIFFEELDKNHADLILKLRSKGLTQKEFFQCVVRAFIDNDVNLEAFFDNLIKEKSRFGKRIQTRLSNSVKEGRKLEERFGLTEEEKSSIFDILEVENFDL